MKQSLIETDYHRNLTAPLHYCSMLSGKFPSHNACCTYALLSLLKTALSTPWLAEACLIKIPLAKLLLIACVDLSDASLHRKNKRCWFLEKLLQDATKPNLPPNEQFNIARTPRNINAPGVINAFNHHSACLHHFRAKADWKQTAVLSEASRETARASSVRPVL